MMPDCASMWWWWGVLLLKLIYSANNRLMPYDFDLSCLVYAQQDPRTKDIAVKYIYLDQHILKHEMGKWIKTLVSLSITFCTFVSYT
jgi:hypothetical protein